MTAEFKMQAHDYGIVVDITCSDSCSHPNQIDLRHAINTLLNSLSNWENVNVVIKTVEES